MRAAPASEGCVRKAMSGLSATSRWKFETPATIGATITVSIAGVARDRDLRAHGVEIAGDARHVVRRRAAQRGRDRGDALRERRIGLVGEAVIVLDVVDAAVGEAARELGELRRRQALRLDARSRSARACRRRRAAAARRARGAGRRTPRRRSSGISASCSTTSSWIEVLPNSMLTSWPASRPTVAADSEIRASNRPAPISRMPSTRPTISDSTCLSSIAASGISTLCSTAIACARASIDCASQRM